ncbi:hypothetical protein CCHR01_09236 [Colletotrichum chrysophilum]|uniref:C2H2-type domain-containing protein n=1 Tax=Colletotrichum chrysophilum TaxID=1836956 RepID=A0AAD9AIR8_9PEZI|nr:hypothetical protein CCHR01_09236 [Colletotrichum chrysophilum]
MPAAVARHFQASYPFNLFRRSQLKKRTKRCPPKIDFSPLLSRWFKAHRFSRPSTCLTDMPENHQEPTPNPKKSSDTLLAVRQASGTSTNGSSRSRIQHRGGGSEQHSSTPPPPRHSASASESTSSRAKTSPPANKSIDSYLEWRKAIFINIFMAKLEDFLDDAICTLEEAKDYEGQGHNDTKSTRARGVKRSASAGKLNPVAKRQHRESGEEPNESDDEDNDEHNRVQKKRTKTGDGRKFACPFYKFDSERWKNERTCCGPGWYEIHRLKEHLYRTHLLVTCTRCFGHFKSEKLLQTHQRTKDECVWQDESSCVIDVGAGIDSKKEKLLKARSKAEDGVGKCVYRVLTWDLDYDAPNGKNGLSNDDDLKRKYECFLRREIPKMIHQQLVADVEKEFQDLGATVQGRLGSWIKIAAEKCATVFQSIPTPTEAAALPNPDTRPSSRAASPAAADVCGPSILDTFDPYAYELGLPLPENFILNFDSEIDRFQPLECMPNYDSAYGTGSYGLDGSSETWHAEPEAH